MPPVADLDIPKDLRDHVDNVARGFTCSLDFAVEAISEFHPFTGNPKRDSDENEDTLALRRDWLAVGQDIQTALGRFERELVNEPHARE